MKRVLLPVIGTSIFVVMALTFYVLGQRSQHEQLIDCHLAATFYAQKVHDLENGLPPDSFQLYDLNDCPNPEE